MANSSNLIGHVRFIKLEREESFGESWCIPKIIQFQDFYTNWHRLGMGVNGFLSNTDNNTSYTYIYLKAKI